jgi:hypothetical protein
MLIEAVVDKGQLRLLKPVQFAHDHVHVSVDIPDNEIVGFEPHHADVSKSSSSLIKQLWAARKLAFSDESDLLDGIEKKYE